jgi:thermostable 8-oxoguanine DNA glycosylase
MKWIIALQLIEAIAQKLGFTSETKELREIVLELQKHNKKQASYIASLKEHIQNLEAMLEDSQNNSDYH